MKRVYEWYSSLPKRIRDSITVAITTVGFISTILSILGISLGDWEKSSFVIRIAVVLAAFVLIAAVAYLILGKIFNKSITLTIRHTPVSICCGNIFEESGMKVIGCDTHFDTRVDDIIISRKSLHGKLVLEHGDTEAIKVAVKMEARRQGLKANKQGLYDFPLGTIIKYESNVDNQTYLMLAMTELNSEYEAHTNMAKFEQMLMKMWREIDRVYAGEDVVLPILGTGISRFDDGPKDKEALLRCMLCTLNSSGVSLNANVEVVIYGDTRDIPLYEYKDMFHTIPRR
jgi:hypothetical protein